MGMKIRKPKISDHLSESLKKFREKFGEDAKIAGDKIQIKIGDTRYDINVKAKDYRENISADDEAAKADNLADKIDENPEAVSQELEDMSNNLPQEIDRRAQEEKASGQRSTDAGSTEKETPPETDQTGRTPKLDAVKAIIVGLITAAPYVFAAGEAAGIAICAGQRNTSIDAAKIERLSHDPKKPNTLMISFKQTEGISAAANDIIYLDHVPSAALDSDSHLSPGDMWRFTGRIRGYTNLYLIELEPGGTSTNVVPIADNVTDYGTGKYLTSFANQARSCINDELGWVEGVIADGIDDGKKLICDVVPAICNINWKKWIIIFLVIIIVIVVIGVGIHIFFHS
jgi:hypothetical protein